MRPPVIPASLAAIVTLAGLGLLYWSLTGLGLLTTAPKPPTPLEDATSGIGVGGGIGGAVGKAAG